jgi:hypothetical protein
VSEGSVLLSESKKAIALWEQPDAEQVPLASKPTPRWWFATGPTSGRSGSPSLSHLKGQISVMNGCVIWTTLAMQGAASAISITISWRKDSGGSEAWGGCLGGSRRCRETLKQTAYQVGLVPTWLASSGRMARSGGSRTRGRAARPGLAVRVGAAGSALIERGPGRRASTPKRAGRRPRR